jgi:hypothetical protein
MDKHDHEIKSVISNQDWLQVYSSCVNDHNVSMDQLIRNNTHNEQYLEYLNDGKLPIDILREKFGKSDLEWENLAEYAAYLKGLNSATSEAWTGSNALEDREKMLDFMVIHDSRDSENTSLSRESIFRSIADDRLNTKHSKTREDQTRQEINGLSELHKRVTD